MKLKGFQSDALAALKRFLELCRLTNDPACAFASTLSERIPEKAHPKYRTVAGLESVPYVCLRLPTGGGKTLLAAESITVAGHAYIERDCPVVLWLVPTNTIRKQTVEALQKTEHPYRNALDAAFDGRVVVFDIGDVTQIRPQDLSDRVCIIVSTIQTLRVSNTEGRKVYAHSENFESHFAGVNTDASGLDRLEDGKVKFSFANLMKLHQPLVIVDEAHNARTDLTFGVLADLNPSCIIEYTATPDPDPKTGSNVLFRASAAEVKAAELIKLPVILSEHQDWRAAVHGAIETRARLAETAKKDPKLIRPIAVLQAEHKDLTVTVEVLKKYLLENENITADRIAIATGEQRELDGVNLFDPGCKVEYVITVEALKEGWDCSFAYVFCSVANIQSATAVEQLLGRVLRMPYAERRPKEVEPLNRAYAHVSSAAFGQAAKNLVDRLITMGFEPDEAQENVQVQQGTLDIDIPGDLFNQQPEPVLTATMDSAPDLSGLAPDVSARVDVQQQPDGTFSVIVKGDITEALENALVNASKPEKQGAVKQAVAQHRAKQKAMLSPAERGERLSVPRLGIWVQGQLQLAEKELILDLAEWDLNKWPAELDPAEFSINETAERWEVDVEGQKVIYRYIDQKRQLELGALKLDWTDLQLARWLDRECRQPDVSQPVMLEFCRKAVAHLTGPRKIELNDLLRCKYQLARAIQQKIAKHRQSAYEAGYQSLLFSPGAKVEASINNGIGFDFAQRPYPSAWNYKGKYDFQRHFYRHVGELKSEGEEFDCAVAIDTHPKVKRWVRNLSNRPDSSWWVLTSSDRFYPDFVAELTDGRVLIIEYKGEAYVTNDDSKEKRNIGELWAEKSGGKGLFLMAEKRDSMDRDVRAQITAVLGKG
jgi:type III restriction enzyme